MDECHWIKSHHRAHRLSWCYDKQPRLGPQYCLAVNLPGQWAFPLTCIHNLLHSQVLTLTFSHWPELLFIEKKKKLHKNSGQPLTPFILVTLTPCYINNVKLHTVLVLGISSGPSTLTNLFFYFPSCSVSSLKGWFLLAYKHAHLFFSFKNTMN